MGLPYIENLDFDEDRCACLCCLQPLCFMYEVIRDDYQCQSGKAYFCANVRNILEGMDIPKHFISGQYVIREITCKACMAQVGWRYVSLTSSITPLL